VPKLTKRVVETAEPRQADYFLWDEGPGSVGGFGLRVWPSRKKTFVFKHRLKGDPRTRRAVIGTYGDMMPEVARGIALRYSAAVEAGSTPDDAPDTPAARQRAREAEVKADREARTMEGLAQAFLLDREQRAKPGTLREYRRLLDREVLPTLGKRRLRDVTRFDVEQLQRDMASRRATANNVLAILGAMFNYAEAHEWYDGKNPVARVRPYTTQSPKKSATREQYAALGAALTRAELAGLPAPASYKDQAHGVSAERRAKQTGRTRGPYNITKPRTVSPANPVTVAALRFLALSGWREQEALSLRWDALDFDRSVAVLGDSKSGRSVRPLGRAALDLVRTQPRVEDNPYVFVGAKAGQHLTDAKRIWDAAREASGVSIRLHDLRHSFTTVARELLYADYVISRLVGHVVGDSMTSRYGDVPEVTIVQAADRIAGVIAERLAGKVTTAHVLPFPASA
jgi:integrase